MLAVRFFRDSRQRLSSVLAEGHADAAVTGDDLVCGAASAILQAAELGLSAFAGSGATVVRNAGFMRIAVPPADRDRLDVAAIVATAELAIEQLARQFPANVSYRRDDETADS